MRSFALVLAVGCASPAADGAHSDSDPNSTDCGEPGTWDVVVHAAAQDADGPVAGATVALDDRGWTDTLLGSGTTGDDGLVTFTATGVTSLENCWGTVLDYWLVWLDGDTVVAEDDMNTELYDVIADGSLEVDVTAFPLTAP